MSTPIHIAGDVTLPLSITLNPLGTSELLKSKMPYFEKMLLPIGIQRQSKMVVMEIG